MVRRSFGVRRVALCAVDFPNLGDLIALLPLLDGVRRLHPACSILLAGRFERLQLAERLGFTDRTLLYREAGFGLWREIRRFRPDLSLCLRRTSLRANLCFGRPSGARLTVGFPGGVNRLVHTRLAPYRPLVDRPRRDAAPLDLLGGDCDLVATVRRVAAAGRLVPPTEPYGLIVPGGAIDEKLWGAERFAAAAAGVTRQARELGWQVVLGPLEAERGYPAVFARWLPAAQLVAGLELPDLARLVLGAGLVLANDCGPAHLAQMGGVPLVQLFGNWDGRAGRRIDWWFDRRPG
ncbi:MAG TPA: glycosyltransferase family 9 protein, partial [Candidatus Polarisedimenticolaceae bacterium]|nr:glycosyltransferase family 9 protein [Candidatus Polarisedimenticolaceae bacterium]